MSITKRIVLAFLAGACAAVGTIVSGGQAQAAAVPPVFPTCSRAWVDADHVRVWFNPGTLFNPNPSSVRAGVSGDVKLDRRSDGIFVGTINRPEVMLKNYVYFSVGKKNGIWTKCERIVP